MCFCIIPAQCNFLSFLLGIVIKVMNIGKPSLRLTLTILNTKTVRGVHSFFSLCPTITYKKKYNINFSNYLSGSIYYRNLQQGQWKYLVTMPPTDRWCPNKFVENAIIENKIVIFSKSFCPFCHKVRLPWFIFIY